MSTEQLNQFTTQSVNIHTVVPYPTFHPYVEWYMINSILYLPSLYSFVKALQSGFKNSVISGFWLPYHRPAKSLFSFANLMIDQGNTTSPLLITVSWLHMYLILKGSSHITK